MLPLRRGLHFISPNDGGCNEGCRRGKIQDLKNRLLRCFSEMMHINGLARTEENGDCVRLALKVLVLVPGDNEACMEG